MIKVSMYPLRFEPIYQYRVWGGRRLSELLTAPLPGDGPIGEAWLLSDRDDNSSTVAHGPLKGTTIRQLMVQAPDSCSETWRAASEGSPCSSSFSTHTTSSRSKCIPRMGRGTISGWRKRYYRRNVSGPSPTSCFPRPSTAATISACPVGSTSITGWQTTGSEWRVSTCLNTCRQAHPADPSRAKGTLHEDSQPEKQSLNSASRWSTGPQ